ncbi:hypothetical protein P9436_06835 [Lysinibacillus capsici]|uniref:hypothetical protein n=1 Tax=Lysinibacillus capsici TaxID=2115968 RepID=UPI0001DA5976|nr:hypothetical protein [Lysinibacillus capsici]EFI67322.1 hypothetical protein BFZC1_17144 [Lysinibacillus fusiformis ZC1]EKU44537.1 hypothetical protein C518_0143 [Lysinibacillus fusiformis ZB2]MBU5252581.1 hypothetical protein [Lysinibacillus capsici]MED4698762.1 hypothetical protein [Lysinibacillus capsici]
MLQKWLFGIGGVVLMFTMCFLFFGNSASEDTLLAKNIMEKANIGTTVVSLNKLTDFDWEKAQIFGPYTTKDAIEETMDIQFKGSISGLDVREDIFLLVFAKEGHAIKTAVLYRNIGDYSTKNGMLTPDNDLLSIK